jgi:hypothetical protein
VPAGSAPLGMPRAPGVGQINFESIKLRSNPSKPSVVATTATEPSSTDISKQNQEKRWAKPPGSIEKDSIDLSKPPERAPPRPKAALPPTTTTAPVTTPSDKPTPVTTDDKSSLRKGIKLPPAAPAAYITPVEKSSPTTTAPATQQAEVDVISPRKAVKLPSSTVASLAAASNATTKPGASVAMSPEPPSLRRRMSFQPNRVSIGDIEAHNQSISTNALPTLPQRPSGTSATPVTSGTAATSTTAVTTSESQPKRFARVIAPSDDSAASLVSSAGAPIPRGYDTVGAKPKVQQPTVATSTSGAPPTLPSRTAAFLAQLPPTEQTDGINRRLHRSSTIVGPPPTLAPDPKSTTATAVDDIAIRTPPPRPARAKPVPNSDSVPTANPPLPLRKP